MCEKFILHHPDACFYGSSSSVTVEMLMDDLRNPNATFHLWKPCGCSCPTAAVVPPERRNASFWSKHSSTSESSGWTERIRAEWAKRRSVPLHLWEALAAAAPQVVPSSPVKG